MAISDSDKLDFLWKKVIFGTSRTSASKAGSGETIASPTTVFAGDVWTQTDSTSIPENPPANSTSTVSLYFGANRIQCTTDPTSPPNQTWFATTTPGNVATQIGNFVSPSFGPNYIVQVYAGDPNTGLYARLDPNASGYEFVFDYVSGTLNFDTGIPTNLTSTGSTAGTVSVAGNGLYIEAYQYVGSTLQTEMSAASKTTVVADITARDALNATANPGDIVHVEDASGDPANAYPGDYADYLWTGGYWAVIATATSARADARTQYLTTNYRAFADGTDQVGVIGPGARIVEISVEVMTAFDSGEITVGDSGQNDRILTSDDVDLTSVGVYVVQPYYQFPYGSDTVVNLYYSGTPTNGECKVTITYA